MAIKRGDVVIRKDTRTRAVVLSDEADGLVNVSQKGATIACAVDQLELADDFEFVVFSRRWDHNDTYTLKLISSGWYVSHIAIHGDSDPTGKPFLYENLSQDSISYPPDLASRLSQLWTEASSGRLTPAQTQDRLEVLAREVRLKNGGK